MMVILGKVVVLLAVGVVFVSSYGRGNYRFTKTKNTKYLGRLVDDGISDNLDIIDIKPGNNFWDQVSKRYKRKEGTGENAGSIPNRNKFTPILNRYPREDASDSQNYFKDIFSTLKNMVIPADWPIEKQVLALFQKTYIQGMTNLALAFSRVPERERVVAMKSQAEIEPGNEFNYGVTDVAGINRVLEVLFQASPKLTSLTKIPRMVNNGGEEVKELVEMIKPFSDGVFKMMIDFNQETIDF